MVSSPTKDIAISPDEGMASPLACNGTLPGNIDDRPNSNGTKGTALHAEESLVNGLRPGLIVAALSNEDPTTPFWVGEILSVEDKNKMMGNKYTQSMLWVRWYQASGSASDPFDAIYTPAKKTQKAGGDSLFWESLLAPSNIIASFQGLTEEKRLTEDSIALIKGSLYK